MELEKLNKSQIVLLTLLVSFMTSIATGIVTVSLMQQAPPAITQTVSKVIEHTVEKAVPGQAAAAAAAQPTATPVPIEKTVIVKQADEIAQAIDTISPSIVRLYSPDPEVGFISLGIVLDASSTVAADGGAFGESVDAVIQIPGGKTVRMFVIGRDAASGIAYLQPASTTNTALSAKPATIAMGHVTLGKTIVALAGKSATRIGVGVITALSSLLSENKDSLQVIETNISVDAILPGSPIIDTDGDILGVSTAVSRASSGQGFVTASAISLPASPKEEDKSTGTP